MPDLPRYWTPAFIDRFVDALNSDPEFQREASRFSDVIVLQCLDAPGGKDVRAAYSIDAGYVTVEVTAEDAPSGRLRDRTFDSSRAMARATAPYGIWKDLDTGTLSVLGALGSPEYHIDGPRLKIMMNLGIMNQMSRVASGVPKTY